MITHVRQLVLLLIIVAAGVPGLARAVVITLQSIDVADQVPGEDLWRYEFSVSGSFVPFGGFIVKFDPALYRALEAPLPDVNNNWSVFTVEPDLGLGAEGLYWATALVANPLLGDPFVLTVEWLGSGAPGGLPFEVLDDSFGVLQSGTIQPLNAVPLPSSLALTCIGLVMLVWRRASVRS